MNTEDAFTLKSAWKSTVIYTFPAATLLALMVILDTPSEFLSPVMMVYFVGMVAHLASFGFQGLGSQIAISTDHAVKELREVKE